MNIIAALTEPSSIRKYLEGVGLSARAPPIAKARPQPQQEFDTNSPLHSPEFSALPHRFTALN